jgi:hypothetical protein
VSLAAPALRPKSAAACNKALPTPLRRAAGWTNKSFKMKIDCALADEKLG